MSWQERDETETRAKESNGLAVPKGEYVNIYRYITLKFDVWSLSQIRRHVSVDLVPLMC